MRGNNALGYAYTPMPSTTLGTGFITPLRHRLAVV